MLGAKTMAFDNRSEFTEYKKLTDCHDIRTYFCRPGALWEKGTVENTNKMIRRFLPFKVEAASIT
jgi:IS30 family transposase